MEVETAGWILVGGNSTRMGQDKALLDWRGEPLVAHVARAVEEAAGTVTLVGHPERYAHLGWRVVADLEEGCGPLGGLGTVLSHTATNWNLVVACDMPAVNRTFLARLLEMARASQADALVPLGSKGLSEPLCAVYHRRCLAAVTAALGRGARKVTEGLAGLTLAQPQITDLTALHNVNTPQDWAACHHG